MGPYSYENVIAYKHPFIKLGESGEEMRFLDRFKSKQPIEGLIGFYDLAFWWVIELSEEERQFIVDRFRRMETPPDNEMLIRGKVIENENTLPVAMFLNNLAGWFTSKMDAHIAQRIYRKIKELGGLGPIDELGCYQGRHYTTYLDQIKELKESNSFVELETLLLGLIDATEAESIVLGYNVPTNYIEQLAILYRKQKEYFKEIKILSRYIRTEQQTENPRISVELVERLKKAQLLHEKASQTHNL